MGIKEMLPFQVLRLLPSTSAAIESYNSLILFIPYIFFSIFIVRRMYTFIHY
jgi:hypothetical protein